VPRRVLLLRLRERLRRWLEAAYAAHGGASRMSFDAWRELEEDIKCKLEHELPRP